MKKKRGILAHKGHIGVQLAYSSAHYISKRDVADSIAPLSGLIFTKYSRTLGLRKLLDIASSSVEVKIVSLVLVVVSYIYNTRLTQLALVIYAVNPVNVNKA